MSHECLHKRPGGQVGLVLETHCKRVGILDEWLATRRKSPVALCVAAVAALHLHVFAGQPVRNQRV